MKNSTKKLGEILLKENLITDDQLKQALKNQKAKKRPLGEILVDLGFAGEKDIARALARQLDIPFITVQSDILRTQATKELKELVPEKFARANMILPLAKNNDIIVAVFEDPLDLEALDNMRKITKCGIMPAIAAMSDIKKGIDTVYGKQDLLEEAISGTYTLVNEQEEELELDKLIEQAEGAPVVKLVDLIISDAIESRATDIHIEPFAKYTRVRYRIDGILYEISPPSKHMYLPIISRIKILARLDIAEKRLPQDGSFGVRKGNRLIDIRVSTIPTVYGEKAVMRILDRNLTPLTLEDLGFPKKEKDMFGEYIKRRMGLILLTGPTGCGKTTTLYAALNRIKSPEKNIITIEDPVEYRLDGINQTGINPKIGLSFANGLRAFLRQDPDIIMVGEVRDMETAQICIRASLTGHLVFSTVHTNDTASAVTRLIDIGIEPYMVTSSLILVAAQRLMRRLCTACREEYTPRRELAEGMGITGRRIYRAKGCRKCRMTGFYGQTAIYELLPVTNEIKDLIAKGTPPHKIKGAACRAGMQTLKQSAAEKVSEGVTSIEEAVRVTMGIE